MSYVPSHHPRSPEPTDRQAVALHYIREMIALRGYPPSIRAIGKYMGIGSTNGVNDHLKALEHKGYLERDCMTARGMRLTQKARDWMRGDS